jgi:hypothetical protein
VPLIVFAGYSRLPHHIIKRPTRQLSIVSGLFSGGYACCANAAPVSIAGTRANALSQGRATSWNSFAARRSSTCLEVLGDKVT